ncbi:MAG: glycosyltransferase family 2 protein [Candidatus Moraniibacteriota bacterium]
MNATILNKRVSVVIPALNEEKAIEAVIKQIPVGRLRTLGYETEIVVVDNNSTDKTGEIARQHGATVVFQPMRGYGNAYKAGFDGATGDIIVTGDADMTYPFDAMPELLKKLENEDIDFLNTDRLTNLNPQAMTITHVFGNWLLSLATKLLFGWPFKDSQSGMWIFKREIWQQLDVQSDGMPFSQELKIEAYVKGFKCDEVPIEYRVRIGEVKLSTIDDGVKNILQLFKKRMSIKGRNFDSVTDAIEA